MSTPPRRPRQRTRSREPPRDVELDAYALALLAAYREEERLPEDVRTRVWARTRQRVATAPGARARRTAAVIVFAAAAGIVATVLGLGAWTLAPRDREARPGMSAFDQDPRPDAAAIERAPATLTGDVQAAEPTRARAIDASTSTSANGAQTSAHARIDAKSKPRKRTADPEVDPLTEELRALERVRAALAEGRPADALARVAEAERRFPRGMLREEREALRVIALCEAGRATEGSTAARAFLAAHPRSALADRVRTACTTD